MDTATLTKELKTNSNRKTPSHLTLDKERYTNNFALINS